VYNDELTASKWALNSTVERIFTRSPSTRRLLTTKRLDKVSKRK
jgi:hypothetical protein